MSDEPKEFSMNDLANTSDAQTQWENICSDAGVVLLAWLHDNKLEVVNRHTHSASFNESSFFVRKIADRPKIDRPRRDDYVG